jgi:hypothetical protein
MSDHEQAGREPGRFGSGGWELLVSLLLLAGSPVRFAAGWWQRSLLIDGHFLRVYVANVSSSAVGYTLTRVHSGSAKWVYVLGIIHRQAWRVMLVGCVLMGLLVALRWFWCRRRGGYYLCCAAVLLLAAGLLIYCHIGPWAYE